jgi:pimeloyl-ACP methyl ester carboxylesterase
VRIAQVLSQLMPAMPEVPGVEHSHHDLATGVRVHLAAAGPIDAQPVLCLHGWPQHWWSWRHVVGELAADHRLLCPDMRGFGWSGMPADDDFTKQRVADDALALLDALGLQRVRLVGHDWGGWAAMLAALHAPERFSSLLAISITSPWVPTVTALRNVWRLTYIPPIAMPVLGPRLVRDGAFPRKVLETARRDGRRWSAEELETYVGVLREPQAAHASSKLYRDFVLWEAPKNAMGGFRGRRFTMPARLLHGRRDPLGTELVQGFKGELELVDGIGHFPPEEAPALVAERIRAM